MTDATNCFVVARNPDPDSTLPYLLRLPIEGGILLKARDRWPTTARVYCHPLDRWPADAEIIEAVGGPQLPRVAARRSTSSWTADATTARRSSSPSPTPAAPAGGR